MSNFTELADAAKSFACGIYREMPGALIPNPLSDMLNFIWDDFCGAPPQNPANLPPPATSPFDGGQCCGSYYDVYGILSYSNKPNPGTEAKIGDFLLGKVGGIVKSLTSDGGSEIFQLKMTFCNGNVYYKDLLSVSTQDAQRGAKITRVVVQNGADNCGSLPKEYPPAPPPPPGGYNSPPIPIQINNGDFINVTFNFVPPPPPPPGGKLPPIVINLVKPELNLKFPITFHFNGEIDFGDNIGGDFNYNQDDRDTLNNISATTNNTNENTTNLNNTVNNFYNNYQKDQDKKDNKPPLPTDFDPPRPAVLPGRYEQERLAFVEVDLTTIPKNTKSQSGDGAPDVFYAGWFEFLREGKSLPRNYIHFANNCFVAPVGADGYAFTLYNGYQGYATAITNKE